MPIKLRQATLSDLGLINQIYNQAVAQKHQTADLRPIDMSQRHHWFNAHDADRYVIQVLELDDCIIGWSSLSKYREGRKALKNTAEISYYMDSNHQGKGHGSYLIEQTIEAAKTIGFKNLVALLLSSNELSIRILEKYSFSEWGRIPKAAEIDNHQFDHLYYGRSLN